jgi:ABC-type transport system involved in multi-copper enzyme maturation permease subunit
MGNAVKAEFRKVFSTKMWWALLIPAVAVAFVFNLGFSALQRTGQDDAGVTIPIALLSLGASFSSTSIFAALFGAMSISGEFRHRTISTTYLTASSRGAVLTAKLITYVVMGLIYGVLTLIFATVGALVGGGSNSLPSGASWLLISLIGIVVIMLWTLFGVGFGGLISNQIAAVVVLLVYMVIGETVIATALNAAGATSVPHYLPVNSASDAVIKFALDQFLGTLRASQDVIQQITERFSAIGLPPWWLGGLVFIAYASVITMGGWAISRRRDIS